MAMVSDPGGYARVSTTWKLPWWAWWRKHQRRRRPPVIVEVPTDTYSSLEEITDA